MLVTEREEMQKDCGKKDVKQKKKEKIENGREEDYDQNQVI